MRLTFKYVLIAAGIAVLGAAAVGGYYAMSSGRKPAVRAAHDASQTVKTVVAEQKSIPITITVNGNVVAINTVDVRPQIQNVVRAIHVVEGQEVRAGQLLFTLDARSDASTVAKAQAQLAKDRADLADAESALKRNQELLAKNFVSQAVVDTARSRVDAARSVVQADQASIESSDIALGYNRISAAISGRIGAISVHVGSLAQPGGTPMVTISQLDPIAVGFSVPERELANIIATYPKLDAPVSVQLPGGQTIEGKLSFVDNATDAVTGTIRMKAQFANPQKQLLPGMVRSRGHRDNRLDFLDLRAGPQVLCAFEHHPLTGLQARYRSLSILDRHEADLARLHGIVRLHHIHELFSRAGNDGLRRHHHRCRQRARDQTDIDKCTRQQQKNPS
jgi:RND family efflux transporter MFP subunit